MGKCLFLNFYSIPTKSTVGHPTTATLYTLAANSISIFTTLMATNY
jgi:hypothetical protein